MDVYENFTTDVSVDREELVKFWESSASGSQRYENWKTSAAIQ